MTELDVTGSGTGRIFFSQGELTEKRGGDVGRRLLLDNGVRCEEDVGALGARTSSTPPGPS